MLSHYADIWVRMPLHKPETEIYIIKGIYEIIRLTCIDRMTNFALIEIHVHACFYILFVSAVSLVMRV